MECQGEGPPQTGHHSWVYPDGSRYEGDWKDGQRHGCGVLHYKCGDIYEGDWKNDKANGHGRFIEANGEVYVGDWVDDKRQGKGEHYDANGQLEYEGDWENDVYHGFGTLYYESGDKYEGEWREEMREGSGTLYYHSGDRYEGSWLQDKANGMGRFTEGSGKVYIGEWKDDKRHGFGTCFYNDGKKEYEGQWRADCYHGQGTIWYNTGDKYEGGWKNDERHGIGAFWYACGNRYEGEWRNDLCHGRGTLFYASGDKYEGEWKFGRANGRGTFSGIDGEVYRGDWKDDQRHGYGALYSPTGEVTYAGQWIDDEQVLHSSSDTAYPSHHYTAEEMEGLMGDQYDEGLEDEEEEEGPEAEDDDFEDPSPRQTVLRRFRDNGGSITAPVARPAPSLVQRLMPGMARTLYAMDDVARSTAPTALPHPDDNIFEDEDPAAQANPPEPMDATEQLHVMDICTWLKRLNLEKYAPNFQAEEITDVSFLGGLTEEDLQKMGVVSIGARRKIMAAIGQDKERQNCIICMDEPRGIVLDPCGHLAMCATCAKQVRHCPMCRKRISKTIVVFVP